MKIFKNPKIMFALGFILGICTHLSVSIIGM